MARIQTTPVKGTRDYLPRDLVRRNRVFQLLRETFERHGYEPLETPAIEHTSALEGKYGAEGERLLFRILKLGRDLETAERAIEATPDGDRSAASLARSLSEMALRYDLTVPFARVIAAHQNEIVMPFRRYQMQPVWRADRPQRGRFREFYQCDVDCVGSRSLTVDAEMIAIYVEVYRRLGFTDFTMQINHRGVLDGLLEACGVAPEQRGGALIAIDKLDKVGLDGVRAELTQDGLPATAVDRLMEAIGLAGAPQALLEALGPLIGQTQQGALGLRELAEIFDYLPAMNVPAEHYAFTLAMARGLAYYTGSIYETKVAGVEVGSVGSGGRYDHLIGMFLGRELPAVGASFGVDRILVALDELGLSAGEEVTTTQALVTLFAESVPATFALAQSLRAAGLRTEVYAEPKELRAQLAFAKDKGIPLAFILGPDELARGEVTLRDMRSREQLAVPLAESPQRALALLGLVS